MINDDDTPLFDKLFDFSSFSHVSENYWHMTQLRTTVDLISVKVNRVTAHWQTTYKLADYWHESVTVDLVRIQ